MDDKTASDAKSTDSNHQARERNSTPSADVNRPADLLPENSDPQNKQPNQQYFVSYSRTEYYFPRAFVEQLRKNGLNIWFDQEQLLPGTEWKTEIDFGLKNCAGLILVVSRASLGSANVAYEWQSAMRQHKPVYLVLSEAVDIGKIELISDYIDVTQYGLQDLVSYARKIVDLRTGYDKRTSLLVKHILQGNQINGCSQIPKPSFFGLQLVVPLVTLIVALTLLANTICHVGIGALFAEQFIRKHEYIDLITCIFSFGCAYLLLRQTYLLLTRNEFSIAQMRGLIILSFVVYILAPIQLSNSDLVALPFTNPVVALILIGTIYTLWRLTFLRGGLLRWLRRDPVESGILDQPEVQARVKGRLLPNVVPGLAIISIVTSFLFWLWYRLTEPPLRLTKADQLKTPPTYNLLHVETDSSLAKKVEKALKQYKMKLADKTSSDMTIAIITNHSDEALLQDVMGISRGLMIILATSIVSQRYFETLGKYQWFDYRRQNNIELYDFARTVFSQEYSYQRGLPPSVKSIIVPDSVSTYVTLIHILGSLVVLLGGGAIGGGIRMLLTHNLPLPALLVILFGGLSVWSGIKCIKETGNILNRRFSSNRQWARLLATCLPTLGVGAVMLMGESNASASVASSSFSLFFALTCLNIIIILLAFTFAAVSSVGIWFPSRSVAKGDQSDVLFGLEAMQKKWRPFLYGSTIVCILLGIASWVVS